MPGEKVVYCSESHTALSSGFDMCIYPNPRSMYLPHVLVILNHYCEALPHHLDRILFYHID